MAFRGDFVGDFLAFLNRSILRQKPKSKNVSIRLSSHGIIPSTIATVPVLAQLILPNKIDVLFQEGKKRLRCG